MDMSKGRWVAVFGLGMLTLTSYGYYSTQTVTLNKGWNAVYLQVQPDEAACDAVFAGWPVTSVSLYNMERSYVQYTENPNEPLDQELEYLTWVPGHPTGATALNSVLAGQSYLIFATNTFSQTITGRPAVPRIEWIPSATKNPVNLVGFSSGTSAKFGAYLAGAGFDMKKVSISQIKGMDTIEFRSVAGFTGGLSNIAMIPGQAYAIACNKVSSFSGPVRVFPAGTGGIFFPANSSRQQIRLKNDNGAPLTVALSLTHSAKSTSGIQPILPTLYYFDHQEGWKPFESAAVKVMQANEEWTIPLAIDRSTMISTNYGGVFICSDSAGGQVKIPLEAEYGVPDPTAALWPAGLWVGKAVLNQVSQVLDEGTILESAPTGSPMELRLILHVEENSGRCRLLQRVLIAGSEDIIGNWTPALYVKESAVPVGLRSVRISSVAFGLDNDITWDETAGKFGDTLQFTYTIGAEDPVNPLRHAYHPDHDGLDVTFKTKLPVGDKPQNYIGEVKPELFSISNTVSLVWSNASDADGGSVLWNPSERVSGDLYFQVDGLRREGAILMKGLFELRRISQVGTLSME